MIANYRVPAELSAIDSTADGKSLLLGTVDGCLTVLVIADPKKEIMQKYLEDLPSRDEEVSRIFTNFITRTINKGSRICC